MPKKEPTDETAKPAGQNDAGSDKGAKLPCRVKTNGMLYNGCHHRINKQMAIPEADARKLEQLGHVEILPGLA